MMKKTLVFLIIAITACSLILSQTHAKSETGEPAPAKANQKVAKFGMPYLECFKTTEAGEDEVYLVVSGNWRGGESFQHRFPNASGHWDLNDREGDPPVKDQNLINFTMNDGDAVDLVVMVMEEDGGTSGGWTSLAGSVIGLVNPKAGSIITTIGKFLTIEDSDDFIGAFSVHIQNEGGNILAQFKPRDRVSDISDPNEYWIKAKVVMNGDGSDYSSVFSVTD